MIEIPNLEQPAYAQHELAQLQEQYNQMQLDEEQLGSPEQPQVPLYHGMQPSHEFPAANVGEKSHRRTQSTTTTLESPINLYEAANSPYISLPQLVNTTQSPLAADMYFSSSTQQNSGYDPPYMRDQLDLDRVHHDGNIDRISEVDESFEDEPHLGVVAENHIQPGLHGSVPLAVPEVPVDSSGQDIYQNTSAFMISSKPPELSDSRVSLQLSEYARELDVEPQIVEYDQAHSMQMVSNKNLMSPVTKTFYADGEKGPSDKEGSVLQFPNPTQTFSEDQPLTTPRVGYSARAVSTPMTMSAPKLEPSPQLPPPSQKKSMTFVLPRGEEFHQMKQLTATEPKSPAEYTLHIIFTQFVRHAERKLNLCLDCPLQQEPAIIELLAEGVDSQFDEIIFSLGYIAKKKPKQVIDSVMFWRKSKSEVAALATAELEKALSLSHSNTLVRPSAAGQNSSVLPKASSPKAPLGRGKRSLSLMRTKSFSKLAHRRNASTSAINTNDANHSASYSVNGRQSQEQPGTNIQPDENVDDRVSHAKTTAIQAEKKSLASIYILCRVLIEVVKQTSNDALGDDFGSKLEEIVYNQLKTTDPVATSESFVRSANWNLFSELLGFMSEKRFLSVSDRFIADLEKVPLSVAHGEEPKIHLLIHGMRYLRLTNYPLESFEEGAEFIQSLTKFFCKSQNLTIVFAYAEVLSSLILPLASELTAEANHPLWVEATTQMYKKAHRLCYNSSTASQVAGSTARPAQNTVKGTIYNEGDSALILMTSALAVSSQDLFGETWFELIESNINRLKPKVETAMKTRFMTCISRLVWVYINRLPDTLNNTVKKLDRLFDLLFFGPNVSGKKQQWLTHDIELINSVAEIIRIVAFSHFNYVLDNVILKLLRGSFGGMSLENVSPEKLILVVKAYTLCLRDFKSGKKPEFPKEEIGNNETDEIICLASNKSIKALFEKMETKSFQKWSNLMFEPKLIKNHAAHEEITRSLSTLLKLVDHQYGSAHSHKSDSGSLTSTASKSFTSLSSFPFGIDLYQGTRNVFTDLFAVLIDGYTWTSGPLPLDKSGTSSYGLSIQTLVDILIRNATHEVPFVASSAILSLAKLASRKSAGNILTVYARIAFRITEKPGPSYDSNYFNSDVFVKLLKIYVELLKCWLRQVSNINEK
ncbi:hypothetical protein OXX69_002489, partial [Metschnikowia pulcherrima]